MMGDVPDINPAPLGNDFVESLPDDQAAKTTDVSDGNLWPFSSAVFSYGIKHMAHMV